MVVVGALLAAVAGLVVGMVEILDRYRDEPGLTLKRWPAIAFLAVNGVAAALAFALVHGLGWTLGLPDSLSDRGVIVIQALAAAFATLAIFRVQFLSVGSGPGATAVSGPSALLELLLAVCDRSIDRSRAPERQDVVTQVLVELSFEDDHLALTHLAVSSLSRLQGDDADSLGRISRELTATAGMTDHQRMVCYGLDLLRITGRGPLEAAANQIRSTRPAPRAAARVAEPGIRGAGTDVSPGLAWASIPSFPPAPPYPERAELEAELFKLQPDAGPPTPWSIAATTGTEEVGDLSRLMRAGKVAYLIADSHRLANEPFFAMSESSSDEFTERAAEAFRTVAYEAATRGFGLTGVVKLFLEAVESDALLWALACDITGPRSSEPWSHFGPLVRDNLLADAGDDDSANITWHAACLLCLRELFLPAHPDSLAESALVKVVQTPDLSPPRLCHPVIVAALLRVAAHTMNAGRQLALVELAQRFDGNPGVSGLRFAVELLRDPAAFMQLPDSIRFAALSEIDESAQSLDSELDRADREAFVIGPIADSATDQLASTHWGPAVRELHAAKRQAIQRPSRMAAASVDEGNATTG